jgi:large subunit ribosomal protein L23
MGLFDRIRKKHEDVGKDKKPANPTDAASKAAAVKPVETKPEEKKSEKPRVLKTDTKHAYRTLLRPVLTEKSTRLTSQNQYVFAVPSSSSKIEIRDAVFAAYGIRPLQVTTTNVHGKAVRFGRVSGTQKNWKKAIVTLPAGKTIDVSN